MKFKRFTKAGFLKQIGRGLLTQFFDRFTRDLAEKRTELPRHEIEDDEYFAAISRLALSPDGLPDNLIEAIYGIEAMANDQGQERLERAAGEAGLDIRTNEESTHADIAIKVWLADPGLFAIQCNEHRLTQISAFEAFCPKVPVDRSGSFSAPDEATISRMTADMDAWFTHHNRGHQTTHIEVCEIAGEFWFLIRHGATFARMPTAAENRCVRVLHFRPTKDDVAVYSAERDEIRIHASTKGERELYREVFGTRLFSDPQHFSERKAFDLEPLRADGADALDTEGLPGISQIILREIEWAWDNGNRDVMTLRANDVFACGTSHGTERNPFSSTARLVKAGFDVYFGDALKPRKVQIRPPNVLKLGRHCDTRKVYEWLAKRGFRTTATAALIEAR